MPEPHSLADASRLLFATVAFGTDAEPLLDELDRPERAHPTVRALCIVAVDLLEHALGGSDAVIALLTGYAAEAVAAEAVTPWCPPPESGCATDAADDGPVNGPIAHQRMEKR